MTHISQKQVLPALCIIPHIKHLQQCSASASDSEEEVIKLWGNQCCISSMKNIPRMNSALRDEYTCLVPL